jgi:hypothetical protein
MYKKFAHEHSSLRGTKQSRGQCRAPGLPRRVAPRNDDGGKGRFRANSGGVVQTLRLTDIAGSLLVKGATIKKVSPGLHDMRAGRLFLVVSGCLLKCERIRIYDTNETENIQIDKYIRAYRTRDRPDPKAAVIVFIGKDKFEITEVL